MNYLGREQNIPEQFYNFITSLLRRMQAQTLPNATPSLGKIPRSPKLP